MVELDGLPVVLANLEISIAAMKGAAASATEKAVGSRAAESMRQNVAVRTGELRGDIRDGESDEGGHEIVIDNDHAVFVEFGTSHMSEQPFLRPAMHLAEQELPDVARSNYQRLVPFLDAYAF